MTKILIHSQDHLFLVNIDEITHCQSDNCYTQVRLYDNKQFIVSKSLTKFAQTLNPVNFIRVHQSFLINRNFIRSIDKKKRIILLVNDLVIPFSITIKDLINMLN